MKGTFGRITRGPNAFMRPHTVVLGNLSRSVRDAARYYDVCAGTDPYDPTSLPSHGRWEAGLGTHDLKGKKVAVVPALGGVTLEPGVEDHLRAEVKELLAITGMVEVDVQVDPPNLAAQWAMGNLATLLADLGRAWPSCSAELTDEVAVGLHLAEAMYNLQTAAAAEELRVESNKVMAAAFEQADFIVASTNPGPAFAAEWTKSNEQAPIIDKLFSNGPARYAVRGFFGAVRVLAGLAPKLPSTVLGQAEARFPDLVNMGALTIIANIYGNPAVSIPSGTIGGLPVGMQVLAPHHHDGLLFDVALSVERERPWPLVAPTR
jgi:aspartyl-tRNA(Asn)/glutamyl-tRNA(Gln) amidotransferase subunit A